MKNVPSPGVTTSAAYPIHRSLKTNVSTAPTLEPNEESIIEDTIDFREEQKLKLPLREYYNRTPASSRLWENIMERIEKI